MITLDTNIETPTLEIELLSHETLSTATLGPKEVRDFLYDNLGKFRDSKDAISRAIDFALSEPNRKKGEIFLCFEVNSKQSPSPSQELVGVVVMNRPGMVGYVPENFLVYIAVKEGKQGKGIGTFLFSQVLKQVTGGISLHVEHDNPAKKLYQRLGFTEKYAEMRLER